MPANKKKKKLASNSSRGFATTSVPSKHVNQDAENVVAVLPDGTENQPSEKQPTLDPDSAFMQKDLGDYLHKMSPEELAKHLETSELQLLIDRHGERTRRNTSRQLSRINVERRLLRTHAVQLRSQRWLPEGLIQFIIEHIDVLELTDEKLGEAFATGESLGTMSEDDILVRIWTLNCLLTKLGLPDSYRDEALRKLLRTYMGVMPAETEGKDSVWGLEFCLGFIARHAGLHELPSYDARDDHPSKHPYGSKVSHISTPDSTPDVSRPTTPLNQLSRVQPAEETADAINGFPQVSTESENELDSDLEPDEMMQKYLIWQTRRFHILSRNSEYDVNLSANQVANGSTINNLSLKLAGLDSKLALLKSDVLFDKDEADRRWASLRIELNKEAADRRRLGIDENVKGEMPKKSPSTISDEDEDEGPILGELFSSLPDLDAVGDGSVSVTNSTGNIIRIRDFGKWTGISPRRVLEEACRARDSSSKVIFKSLSATTFSKRHQVQVQWSRDQESVCSVSIDGVSCECSSRRISVEMLLVSCPDALQSEAYISTIALFSIVALSPKEEKIYIRLPAVWRDLWEELTLLRKTQNDDRDIQKLQDLRNMIAEAKSDEVVVMRKNSTIPIRAPLKSVHQVSNNPLINETSSTIDTEALKFAWATQASTSSYRSMLVARQNLPIWDYKQELLRCLKHSQVMIVCGETGCGKSTQVPAYIMEHELSEGRPCKIYCTQPRRISAISLAKRVSEELGERRGDVGTSQSLVGFAVRLDSRMTNHTRLVYATTGIVMRMLENVNGLEGITHLILDEVHERSIESDFLLVVIRRLMVQRPTLKIVLMSATVDSERFSSYLDGANVLNVPGRTFPVETRFLEDAVEVTRFRDSGMPNESLVDNEEQDGDSVSNKSKSIGDSSIKNYSVSTRETLGRLDEYRINYDLIVRLLETLATDTDYIEYSKAVLIFLPGIAEIRKLNDMLLKNRIFAHGWNLFPLHSTIAMEEQERAFLVPPQGIRKLVIATNIAETGITIPDVTCVIDAGKHKEMRFDERRQLSRLIEVFISRANAKQRRGRAGRVQKGLCFHLFTRFRHDTIIPEHQTPEMLRLSLQDLVLRVKICRLGGVEQTLAEALDPPSAKNVQRAMDSLVEVKALTSGETLTHLGRQLAKLPLDVFLGKLVLLGTIFSCLDGTLTIAAMLSSKSPFSAPISAGNSVDLARMAFKKSDSDLLTMYNAYCAWRRVCTTNHSMSEQQFCRRNSLNAQNLSSIEELKAQLLLALADENFVILSHDEKQAVQRVRSYSRQRSFVPIPVIYNKNMENDLILNSVAACAFYPKLLKRDGKCWRNIANNQSVSLHPSSINKGADHPPQWLSFYHMMQSSNKLYNAHETSGVEDIAIALLCGEAEFRMYSGVLVIDGNRVRFAVNDWKQMLVLKTLRTKLQEIMAQAFKRPGHPLSEAQRECLDIVQKIFTEGDQKYVR